MFDFSNLPYDSRNMRVAGLNHGVGLACKVGEKKSGFSEPSKGSLNKPKNLKSPKKF